MKIVFGVLAGLFWGALGAFVNYRINLAALKKQSSSAMLGASLARMGVDLVALGSIFLARKVLPFSFEAALLAAGIALSLGAVGLAYYITRPKK